MPKSIPTNGQANWGTALNSHLGQLNEPTNGGINFAATAPTGLTANDVGYTYVDTTNKEIRRWNGTNWITLMGGILIGKKTITADFDLYVSQDGNDTTGDGTQAKPFKTIQFAVFYTKMTFDKNGFYVRIKIADSGVPYAGCIITDSNVSIIGNVNSISAVVIDAGLPIANFSVNTSDSGVALGGGTFSPGGNNICNISATGKNIAITGVKLVNNNNSNKSVAIALGAHTEIRISKIIFGQDLGSFASSGWVSSCIGMGQYSGVTIGDDVTFGRTSDIGIWVNAYSYLHFNPSVTVKFSDNAGFWMGFIQTVVFAKVADFGAVYSGAVTGPKYQVTGLSNLGGKANLDTIPSPTAGIIDAKAYAT